MKEKVAAMGLNELVIPFSARFESKLLNMSEEEGKAYCEKYHTKSQMPKIITTGYHVLNLIHFFTAGPDEVKCWTIRRGTLAPQAAGVITLISRSVSFVLKYTSLKTSRNLEVKQLSRQLVS